MQHLLYINLCCPYEDCGRSLSSEEHPIGGRPSAHLIAEKNGTLGDIYLSGFYDDYRTIEPDSLDILPGDVIKFHCPHCGKELPFAEKCACKAPMVYIGIENNGQVRICTRKGCHYHTLEFGSTKELQNFMKETNK